MSAALILGLVGALLMLAFLANRVFRVTRVPDVLVLMALGLVLGPVLGFVDPAHLSSTTNVLGTLAIILVLFEGGWTWTCAAPCGILPGAYCWRCWLTPSALLWLG